MITEHNEEYEVQISPAAKRDLDKIPIENCRRIDNKILQLANNPRPPRVIKLKKNIYRIRVGNYRIIYIIDDVNRIVVISRVKKRSEETYKSI